MSLTMLVLGLLFGWVIGQAIVLVGYVIWDSLHYTEGCGMIRSSEVARIRRELEAEEACRVKPEGR